jgi:hypothetical protein
MLYVKKMKAKTERDDELVRLVVLPFSSTGFLFPPLSICIRVPLVLAEDGGREGYPAVMLLLLFAASGGRIRLLCCSCLLLLKVAEELQLVMTAPLLVPAPSAEKKAKLLLATGKRYR